MEKINVDNNYNNNRKKINVDDNDNWKKINVVFKMAQKKS